MTTKYEAMKKALAQFVEDAIEIDVGGGDVVYTSCESLIDAKIAIAMPEDAPADAAHYAMIKYIVSGGRSE